MTTTQDLIAERLGELLSYEPETGVFRWRVSRGPAVAGSVAGSLTTYGYIKIKVDGRFYRAHRLAWIYVHGVWPSKDLDHKDENKANNRLKNLREASSSQNGFNVGIRTHNTTGFKGVCHHSGGKFQASAKLNGKRTHLGLFITAELASEAYQAFAKANHGDFYKDKNEKQ